MTKKLKKRAPDEKYRKDSKYQVFRVIRARLLPLSREENDGVKPRHFLVLDKRDNKKTKNPLLGILYFY